MGVPGTPRGWQRVKVEHRLKKEVTHRKERPVAVVEMVKEVNNRVEAKSILDPMDHSRLRHALKEQIAGMPWKLALASTTIPGRNGRRSIGSIRTTRQLLMQCSSSAMVRKVMSLKEKEKERIRVRTKEKEKAKRRRAKVGTPLTM